MLKLYWEKKYRKLIGVAPAEKVLAVLDGKTLLLVDYEGAETCKIGLKKKPQCLAASKNLALVGYGKNLFLVNTETLEKYELSLKFKPQVIAARGSNVVIGGGKNVEAVDIFQGSLLWEVEADGNVRDIAISEKLVSIIDDDNRIMILDRYGQKLAVGVGAAMATALGEDILVVTPNGYVREIRLPGKVYSSKLVGQLEKIHGAEESRFVAYYDGSRVVVEKWGLEPVGAIEIEGVDDLCISPKGEYVAVSKDNRLKLYANTVIFAEYLEKLEEMRREGKLSEKTYMLLRESYEKKL